MKFATDIITIFTVLAIGLGHHVVSAHPEASGTLNLKPRRQTSILINPPSQPKLPSLQAATKAAATVGLNLDNIQGDILIGMKKQEELFFFFGIQNATGFKQHLAADIHPLITTTTQMLSNSTQPNALVNIAFSQTGLTALNVTDSLGDSLFSFGQHANLTNLGDPGDTNWVPAFAGTTIHGVFLIASDTIDNVNSELSNIQGILGDSITELHRVQGQARPGDQNGHEHFGFADGISQPAVNGFTANPNAGQLSVDPGFFLLGETGDASATTRPSWAQDGSFLAFRQLKQLVPEFDTFLTQNALSEPSLTAQQNADLLGARMIGRWKSGAPVDLAPLVDDPVLGKDSTLNNNFTFAHPGEDISTNQTRCPFSAHIRKSNPRADLGAVNNHIIRSGIPYGPEVTDAETASGTSDPTVERGLAFVAYQSDISQGFAFLQQKWIDNQKFPPGKTPQPGFDPILGANAGQSRLVDGLNPLDNTTSFTLTLDFVVSRGGEYFFSPSLSAILDTIAA